MSLIEGIKKAIQTDNTRLAGKLADYMRFRCGMTYNEIISLVQRCGFTQADWEDVMEGA